MNLEVTRVELQKAKKRLERYQAVLRLANIEIEQRNRNIVALTTFAHQACRTGRLNTVLKLALVQALETIEAPVGAVILIDSDTKELTLGVHKGLTPQLVNILTGLEIENGATALMPHLVAGDGALLEYETADDPNERQLLAAGCLTGLVSLPLQMGSELFGSLLVGLQGHQVFKPSELCFLLALSQETAVLLDSLRLRQELWHTAEALLGEEKPESRLKEIESTDLNLGFAAPFNLLTDSPTGLQPAEDDLEQLLAAMMDAEDEVQQQNADLQTLNIISEMMNRTLDLKEILRCAVDQTQITLETDAVWLYLIDEQKALRLQAHTGLSEAYVRGMHCLKPGEGLEGRVAVENRPSFVQDIRHDAKAYKIWVDKEGLRAMAAVPLTCPGSNQSENRVIGVLAVGARAGQSSPQAYLWGPREIRLLASIANQVALAINNARLYARLQDNEVSMRAGNEVLRTINDMLLEKNNFLEGFIRDDLVAILTQAADLVQQLQIDPTATLPHRQKQPLADLQNIVNQLLARTCETGEVTVTLDTEFDKTLDDKYHKSNYTGSTMPPRLQKLERPPLEQSDPPQKDNFQSKTDPPSTNDAGNNCVPPKSMSFEEAVAAGLVPPHILRRETPIS